jgi:hypothetical protein
MTELKPTRTYYARSMFVTKTLWVNLAGTALEILNYTDLVPLYPGWFTAAHRVAVIGLLNIGLRRLSDRPARFIGPKETTPVQVETLPSKAQSEVTPAKPKGGPYG